MSYLKLLLLSLALFLFADITTFAQSSVTTQHYDIARTGANTNETILTPTNVNANTFGKLFSYPLDGWVYAQPLYMPGVTMGAGTVQAGTTHNVVFVATEHDSVFAFDADSNTGANANPLWQVSLLGTGETTVPSGDVSTSDIIPEIGITSTPVIDPTTNTIYVVAKSTVADTTFIQRLHALDITTGKEKFGGPVTLSASVPGTGNGSSGGTLNWDPKWENNRTSLLLLNGIVYIGFGSHGDNGPWHGWILAYNASTLTQTGAWCSTPNAVAAGIWMAGTGLAADVPSGKPYGRIFTATGNGTFDATAPNYTNAMDYGDSIIKLDLNNGAPTMNANGTVVGDDFTPHDQAHMDNADEDVASGGVVLLPDSVGGGGGAHQLVQVGKSGRVFVLNRENLGGYNPNNTTDPEQAASVGGLWGAPAYWNGNVYIWGTYDNLKAFSFANGALSANPTSTSNESAATYSPTPSVSANGTSNGIVWSLKTDNYSSQGTAILYAHDASNVATLLYSSESNEARDNPGNSVKFIVPTVINGKVYVGSESQLSVFGLLNGSTQAATPVITPASQSFSPSVQVTITDSTSGASIYYTTNGSQPTTGSTKYTGPFTLTTTTTVNAIAAGAGLEQSPEASATYTLTTQAAMPTFNPPPGPYTAVQSVTISTTTPNATIYCTTNGTTPTTASTKYGGPISVGVTETLSAIAVASGFSNSPVASGQYTFDVGVSSINFASGFASGGMNLLGSAKLNGSSLELTDGGGGEAAAAWYEVEANIESFTTDFTFQITPGTNPTADGFTFAIQGNNSTAVGPAGGGLGYGPDTPGGTGGIPNSVAVKFDLYSNDGEGTDSTGLYTNGASPTIPAVDMTSSGVNLHSGDPFHVHITYNGTILAMTITDTTTNATFTTNWTVDIPTIVGDVVAYVGFTAGTEGDTAVQNIQTWTFSSSGGQTTATTTVLTSGLSPSNYGQSVTLTAQVTTTGSTTPTGSVTFKNGTTALGTVSLNASGVATLTETNLPVGSDSLIASYNGDALNGKSTSVALMQTVNQATITMSLTSTPNPSPSGTSVKFTATFTSTGGLPTGPVTFSMGATTLGTATISAGKATFSTAKLPAGSDVVTATYAGRGDYPAATMSVTQVVNATTTVLTSSLSPSNYGQSVTLTAQVTTTGSTTPTGSVTFKNGTTVLGTVSLNASGVATLTETNLPVGSDSLTASYNGDALNGKSTSAAVTQVVNQATITMSLTSAPNPSPSGTSVKFTATFTSTGGLPTGPVTFSMGATTLGTATISAGKATFSTAKLPAGSDVVTATYAGRGDYPAATMSVTQVVNATTTVLTSSLSPSNYGQSVTLTAQVTTTGSTTPTGSVTFKNGTTVLGTVSLNASGVATLTETNLPVGSDSLTASYNGDALNGKSTSAAVTQVVNQATITMSLTSAPNPSPSGTSVKFTATFTSTGRLPTGTVTFSMGATTLGTATISAGKATLSTTTLPQGTVTATYAGSADYSAATASVTQVVN